MNKNLKKEIDKYAKLQDVFKTTRHNERRKKRLYWKDINLDADEKKS